LIAAGPTSKILSAAAVVIPAEADIAAAAPFAAGAAIIAAAAEVLAALIAPALALIVARALGLVGVMPPILAAAPVLIVPPIAVCHGTAPFFMLFGMAKGVLANSLRMNACEGGAVPAEEIMVSIVAVNTCLLLVAIR
jgi:hypothetical protein